MRLRRGGPPKNGRGRRPERVPAPENLGRGYLSLASSSYMPRSYSRMAL
jgi:hypothetical protein